MPHPLHTPPDTEADEAHDLHAPAVQSGVDATDRLGTCRIGVVAILFGCLPKDASSILACGAA